MQAGEALPKADAGNEVELGLDEVLGITLLKKSIVRALGIEGRLVVVTALVLTGFLSLTGWFLDRAFQASIRAGVEEQLRLVVYSLMGAAEVDAAGIRIDELPQPRLNLPGSGMYAAVHDRRTARQWRSPSALASDLELAPPEAVQGQFLFAEAQAGGKAHFLLSYLAIWDDADESELIFQVAVDQGPALAVVGNFRRILAWGLGAVALLVVVAQILAIRWGLRPLRTMAREVEDLEEGRRQHLSQGYPKELTGLRQNLERFVAHEQRRRTRYRNALQDLAHSLKTPLAVLRNAAAKRGADADGRSRDVIVEQLDQMDRTVTHQLSKATVVGPVVVGKPVALAGLVERLVRALQTAYAGRRLKVETDVSANLRVRGDEGDLMEMLGNLLENAFKYTRSKVRVSGQAGARNLLRVEDDGPGIAQEIREAVLNRGTRGDQVAPGQGIGLSVVSELVALYGGSLTIGESSLGGASVEISWPN